jgi:hypothetical protein
MLKDIAERKALLRQIIPKLKIGQEATAKGRIGGLNWAEYFQLHPDEGQALGYGIDKQQWNANNVVGRYLIKTEGIRPSGAPATPANIGSSLLKASAERKALLRQIIPDVPKHPATGQLSWRAYFETHPDHATALGYDIVKSKPKIWAANLRMTQQKKLRTLTESKIKSNGLAPYKVETPNIVESDAFVKLAELEANNRDLKAHIRKIESELVGLKAEMDEARTITFELLVQLKRAKG